MVPDTAWRMPVRSLHWPELMLAALAVYALRLACSAASGASLHVDEAQYWDWSRQLQWGYHSKPPLIAALIAASTALFGDGEAAVRALAMACWPLTALALAGLARDMAPRAPTSAARWAAALLLCSPMASLLGLVATTDAPLMLCSALALWGLWRGTRRADGRGWALFALAVGLGLLAKYTMAAWLAGAWLLVLLHHRRQWPALLVATLVALLLWSPHLAWNAAQGWPTLRHTAEITVGRAGSGWAEPIAFVCAQALLLAPLVLVALPWVLRHDPPPPPARTHPFLLWTGLPLVAAGLLQALRSGAQVNWIAPAHLLLALALAIRLAATGPSMQRRLARLLVVQALLLAAWPLLPRAAASAGLHVPPVLDPWARMRGWSEALDHVAAGLPDGPVLVVSPSRTVMAQAAYHWRQRAIDRAAWRDAPTAAHHYEARCPLAGGPPPGVVTFVLADTEPPPRLQAALGPLQPVLQAPLPRTARRAPSLMLLRAQAPAAAPAFREACR